MAAPRLYHRGTGGYGIGVFSFLTATREAHRWLIGLLPLAGFAVGWIYLRYGTRVEAGNNLILDEIHDPQRVIPLRMAPLVFFGTVVSHLFGA